MRFDGDEVVFDNLLGVTPARLCFVNCGLPGDQCACYRAQHGTEIRFPVKPEDKPELVEVHHRAVRFAAKIRKAFAK